MDNENTFEDTKGNKFATHKEAATSNTLMGTNPSIQQSSPIPASDLKPTTDLKVPPAVSQTNAGLDQFIGSVNTTAKTEAQLQDERKQKLLETETATQKNDIGTLIQQIGQSTARESDIFAQEGGDVAKKQVDELTSQIEAEQLASRRQVENIIKNNPTGALRGGAQDLINNIQRDSLSKQADLAILQSAALRRYDTASSIAQRKVQAELEPMKARLDALKFFYADNKESLTKAQDRAYQEKIKKEDREYNKQEDNLKQGNEMIINALKGQAPQSLIQKAQDVLNKGGTSNDVARVLGQYSMSIADRLDVSLKQAQLNKLRTEFGAGSGEMLSQDDINAKQNEIVNLQDKISNIDGLINHKGLSNAVGTVALGRKAPFQIGEKQDFIASVQQLVSRDTLDTLINLKKAGGTLGALSDQERIMLQSAASKIGTWAKTDKNGRVIGYKASESSFKKELETIKTLSERALSQVGGTQTSILDYLDIVDGVLQVDPYTQAGYILN